MIGNKAHTVIVLRQSKLRTAVRYQIFHMPEYAQLRALAVLALVA